TGTLVAYYTGFASSDDQFEPTDGSIIDLRLPADGTYYVKVTAANSGTGTYELYVYRFSAYNPTDGNDILSGRGGNNVLAGGLGTDTVVESGDVNFVLTNTSLTGPGQDTLSGIDVANLTGGAGNNTFTVAGWTGSGTLDGQGGAGDTVVLQGAGTFTLTNTLLAVSGGPSFTLAGVEVANLTGSAGNDTFTVTG